MDNRSGARTPVLEFQATGVSSGASGASLTPNSAPVGMSPGQAYESGPSYAHGGPQTPDLDDGFALSDFLQQLEDYVPTIPDAVTNHFLHQAGFDSTDPRMARLISVAAQKFVADIINESFLQCKMKGAPQVTKSVKQKEKKFVLTLEHLIPVLHEYGITVRKPPYHV